MRKVICSFPRQADSWVFDGLYREGKIELELVPQGNLAERMRAAGAGIGAFFCPTASARRSPRARRPARSTAGPTCSSTRSRATYALIGAHRADPLGNLVYRKTARNFGPVMATAATHHDRRRSARSSRSATLDPEVVVTPSIFVDRIVQVEARSYTVQGAR